jgi:hypothetical protein
MPMPIPLPDLIATPSRNFPPIVDSVADSVWEGRKRTWPELESDRLGGEITITSGGSLKLSELSVHCEWSRSFFWRALFERCAGGRGYLSVADLSDLMTDAIARHDRILSATIDIAAAGSTNYDAEAESKVIRYKANIERRRALLRKLYKSPPVAPFTGAVGFALREPAKDSSNLTDETELEFWKFFLWLTEHFRLRVDAARREIGHEVDSFAECGEQHSNILSGISSSIESYFKFFRSGDMNRFVRSASFLAVANTVEAAALHLKDMHHSLDKFLSRSARDGEASAESECRTAIKCGLAEVSCILTSASKRLIDRRCFAKLLNYGVIEPDELRVLVYPSVDGKGVFIAQCLDFDVVAAGKGPDRAVEQLDSTLGIWFDEFTSGKGNLIHPGIAPACFHSAFLDSGEPSTHHAHYCGATLFQVQNFNFPVKHSYKIRHEKILSGDADVIKSANDLF